MVGVRPFCIRIGICWALGRSTPLKPMRARILHFSSNEAFEPVQTEFITLCLRRPRGAVGVCADGVCADRVPAVPAIKGTAAPAKNVLRSIGANISCGEVN